MRILIVFLIVKGLSEMKIIYPETEEKPVKDTLFGRIIEDPYRWLENVDNEEVKEWVEKQNKIARSILDSLPMRKNIEDEYTEILSKEWVGIPHFYKGKYFFFKRKAEQNHAVLYMSEGKFDPGKAEVIIDPNKFSTDGTIAMDWFFPSPDGSFIAFGKSKGGSENSTLYILDVKVKKVLSDTIPHTKWSSVVWLPDNSGFYYTRNEGGDKFLPRVYLHKTGEKWENDTYIYGRELKETELPGIYASRDNRYIFMDVSRGWDKNDLYFRKIDDEEWIPIAVGFDAIFQAEIYRDYIYIRTNYQAPNFKIIRVRIDKPSLKEAEIVIPEGKGVLKSFTFAGGKLVFTIKEDTYYRAFISSTQGEIEHEIKTPVKGSIWIQSKEYDDPEFFYIFTSFFYPYSTYKFNVKTLKDSVLFSQKLSFNPEKYKQEFVFYSSKDGTKIPMYILYRKDIKLNSKNPAILTGYGGFGGGISPYFIEGVIPFLKRGGVFATAGIRGGDEYGEKWHRQGMREKKQNVFDDFISAAEYLIEKRYTNPEKLAISGASNGGLLVGAVMTQRPELFRAVYCAVPLLDMLRYHKFGVAHIWTPEYGNPDNPDDFKYLYAYSPYHHINKYKKYPAVFFKTSEFDGRVHPMHAMKMAAKMQKIAGEQNPVLLYVEPKAGHGAGKPLKKAVKSITDHYIFLMWQLGMLENR